MMEENQITIVDEDGNEILCNVEFTFDAQEFGNKSYVVFSLIGEYDEDGEPVFDAMIYQEKEDEEGGGQLFPIESEAEWDMVQEVFNTFMDEEEGEE